MKLLQSPNFAVAANTGHMSPAECNRACSNLPEEPAQAGVKSNSQG